MREIQASEGLNGEEEKYMVRRKLIPAEVIIDEPGAFKYFRIKLSPDVKRLTGVMVTMDTMVPKVAGQAIWYLGIGNASNLYTSEFITSLQSGTFEDSYFQFRLSSGKSQVVYYAQPVRMNFFNVSATGLKFMKGATIPVTSLQTGSIEDYEVWTSSEGPGEITITVEIGER